ncbi:ABC transporter permease [Kitasatospora sp. CM 4170]|uniref:FtsX-like permease family protein n=1 Tax=Kitasatospora aburaviensis TaxID=67265 RepID=A0ABW1EXY3_9ACTN|nr:ABC transporter permease [Kitasatospora sp. CM 4170]WNM47025.1 ABC transporter permease [Kitasatospora sp. CM 4170]
MLLSYALQSLRTRRASFAGAFVALFFAALTVTACGTLLETGLRGEVRAERFAGTPIVVAGDQQVHKTIVKDKGNGKTKTKEKAKPLAERVWLPEELTARIAAVPGVRAAVPELDFPARTVAAGGRPGDDRPSYGHSWESAALTPFTLAEGREPVAADELVLDTGAAARAGLRVGDRVTVRATRAPVEYRITGLAVPRGVELAEQNALFFSPAEARRLADHPGRVSAIGVLPAPGTDAAALAGRLGPVLAGSGAVVHRGADRGLAEFPDAANARVKLVSMGGAIGGTALLVAVLVVSGTFALTIQQRSREIALLRAVAATPAQVRRLIGREALLLGMAGGVLGSLAGLPAGRLLHEGFVDLGAVPGTLNLAQSVFPMAVGVLAALFGGWAAARISARRASRIRPGQALAEAAVEVRTGGGIRTAAGLVALAGGVTLVAVLSALDTEKASTPVTFATVLVLAIAVSLLGPVLARVAAAVIGGVLRLSRVSGHLAAANLRAEARRTGAVAAPLALLTAMVCTVLFTQATLDGAAGRQAEEGVRAPWTLAASAPGVPGEAAQAVRALPGVAAVTEVVRSSVRIDLEKYSAQGVTTAGLTAAWDPRVTAGTLTGFGDGDLAVSETAAGALGVHPGSVVRLTLGDGTPAELTVRAVYARGLGFGDLTLSHALLARHVDDPLAAAVLVAADGGVTRERLTAAVAGYPDVRVLDRAQAGEIAAEGRRTGAEVNLLGMGLVLGFAGISVVNTLAMATADRRREFALLRLAGTTRRQILRMLRLEAVAVAVTGAVLGTAIAGAVLTAFSVGMTGSAEPAWPWADYAGVLAVTAVLALAATALPGRAALRGPALAARG